MVFKKLYIYFFFICNTIVYLIQRIYQNLNVFRFKTRIPARSLMVVAGETKLLDLKDEKQKRFVSTIFIHPRYRSTRKGIIADLAVLKVIIFYTNFIF